MSSQRICKKRQKWAAPLKELHVSEQWAEEHSARIQQRLKHHCEAYIVENEEGVEFALVPSHWKGAPRT